MRKLFLIIGLFIFYGNVLSQTSLPNPEHLFEKAKVQLLAQDELTYNLLYTLYSDKENPKILEQYNGYLHKKDENVYLKINTTEMLMTKEVFLKINHDQKAMDYQNTASQIDNPIDISQYLNMFQKKEVSDSGSQWKCTLTTPKLTQLPYGAIEIYFNKNSFAVEKQTLLLVSPGRYKGGDKLKYLDITISEVKKEASKSHFSVTNYVFVTNNKVKPAKPYADYTIITNAVKQ